MPNWTTNMHPHTPLVLHGDCSIIILAQEEEEVEVDLNQQHEEEQQPPLSGISAI